MAEQSYSTGKTKEKVIVIYKGQETNQNENKTIKGIIKDIFGESSKRCTLEREKKNTKEGSTIVKGVEDDGDPSLELISEKEGEGNAHQKESGEMENNTQQVSREGDLSPRRNNYLKTDSKKGKKVPLQVKTRSNRFKTSSDQ